MITGLKARRDLSPALLTHIALTQVRDGRVGADILSLKQHAKRIQHDIAAARLAAHGFNVRVALGV